MNHCIVIVGCLPTITLHTKVKYEVLLVRSLCVLHREGVFTMYKEGYYPMIESSIAKFGIKKYFIHVVYTVCVQCVCKYFEKSWLMAHWKRLLRPLHLVKETLGIIVGDRHDFAGKTACYTVWNSAVADFVTLATTAVAGSTSTLSVSSTVIHFVVWVVSWKVRLTTVTAWPVRLLAGYPQGGRTRNLPQYMCTM